MKGWVGSSRRSQPSAGGPSVSYGSWLPRPCWPGWWPCSPASSWPPADHEERQPAELGSGAIAVFTADSDVKAKLDDVAVTHDVFLALDPGLARRPGRRDRARRHQVIERHNLGLDETALDVGVNDTRGLRRASAGRDRPGPRLFRARGQERGQV